ncbi:MAG: hypothetical protein ING84_14505, partial [Cytophagales bacterium]|nr:hypothetical protein [Cytophagales bacterium]
MVRLFRKVARPWAIVFVLITFANTLFPTVSYALTSGPTAPEATSFEPVDTTDMVNLATGDFTYNIPLLDVPGPAGGYPLSLSYHAGIQPNEDASWVGLGWTLNPGAISRTVNGYPDDQLGAVRTRHDYNHGVSRNTFSVGIGVGGATLNLSISNDSNLGLGIGTSVSIGPSFKVGNGIGIGADFTVGNDGYGNSYSGLSGGLQIGKAGDGARGLTANIGFSTNFNSVSGFAGVGMDLGGGRYKASLIGASISSSGLKPSMTVGGYDLKQTSSFAGRMTTESWGISTPPIPIGPFTLTLGYNYVRYYSDETSDVNVIGTLNAPSTGGKNPDDWSFDSYALLDPDAEGGVIKNNDPDKSKGGSFPAYDSYQVNAQGLGGSIQPYIFDKGTLFRQNLKKSNNSGYIIRFLGPSVSNDFQFNRPVRFRFKNDFSNSLSYESANLRINSIGGIAVQTEQSATPSEGYNAATSHLAGSKHVEYFTNQQIRDGVAREKGFIDTRPQNERGTSIYLGTSTYNVSSQIGGFMITNESGVTYHYALPVYAYGQYSKYFQTGKENDIFQANTEGHPYAYTWYLTAVTGPDYVNRNPDNNGTISKDDWGYWVKFDYGRHSSGYTWRNPVVGTHKDIDQEIESYSYGKKEIYYLNTVQTSTHVAYFETSERLDGRGVSDPITGSFSPTNASATTKKLDKVYLLSRSDFEASFYSFDMGLKAIRTIDFITDYSLTPGTINSFPNNNVNAKSGKLTLKSLKFRGKSGADLIPPTSFQYEKNPAFNKEAYDVWGHYKSDFQNNSNYNLAHQVTSNSAKDVDAWSMSGIATSLGSFIKVKYESDTYFRSVLAKQQILRIKNCEILTGDVYKLTFHESVDLRNEFSIGSKVGFKIMGGYTFRNGSVNCYGVSCEMSNNDKSRLLLGSLSSEKSTVVESTTDFIKVYDPDFINEINKTKTFTRNVYTCCAGSCLSTSSFSLRSCELRFVGFPESIWGGFLSKQFNQNNLIFGGGIRVSEISISSNLRITKTKYSYNLSESEITSGLTSFEPFGMLPPIITPAAGWGVSEGVISMFKDLVLPEYSPTISISREIPAPGVIYKTVTVEEEIINEEETIPTKIPGKKVYEFQTFDEEFIKRMGITSLQDPPYTANCVSVVTGQSVGTSCPSGSVPPFRCFDQYGNQIGCGVVQSRAFSPLTLKDFSAWVGALKNVTTYGANNQILSEVENRYLHDNKTTDQFASDLKSVFKNQGVVSQVFGEYRIADDVAMPIVSRRDEYPLVSIGQVSRDYKTGITTSTENLAFDFYTGNPTKVLSTDGYGNTYVAETVPAYSIQEYSGMTNAQVSSGMAGMGLKVNNPKNKNMLTQSAGSLTYKVNSNYK